MLALLCFLPGCALVSGLSDIRVGDGGTNTTEDAMASSDAPNPMTDGGTELDASSTDGSTGKNALQLTGGCGSNAAPNDFDFTNIDFTITFWYRPDQMSGNDVRILLSHGGAPNSPGWGVFQTPTGMAFCLADNNGFTCTTPVKLGSNVVHIAFVAKTNVNQVGRELSMWTRDTTTKMHVKVAGASNAPSWAAGSNTPFGLATTAGSVSCTNPLSATIDELRIYKIAMDSGRMDSDLAMSVPCNPFNGIFAQWHFDETTGSTAAEECGKRPFMLTGSYAWIPSPFPPP